jgi:hypothetical protein
MGAINTYQYYDKGYSSSRCSDSKTVGCNLTSGRNPGIYDFKFLLCRVTRCNTKSQEDMKSEQEEAWGIESVLEEEKVGGDKDDKEDDIQDMI